MNALNLVFYAPFMPERGFMKKKEFRWFPEVAGYTIYSFDIASDISEVEERDKIYYYKESGFHDLVFRVQRIIEEKFKLQRRKLLITGQSAGSTMAQQLGCYFSDKIDAVAVTGGHRYDNPEPDNRTAWLLLLTAGDSIRLKSHYDLQSHMRGIGLQLLHIETEPIWKNKGSKYFHHTASGENWSLLQLFIKGIVELRDANNGIVPHCKEWPKKTSYDGQTWYLPSKEFAEEWKKLPNEQILELSKYKKSLEKPIYFIPQGKKSKAIVVYIHDPQLSGMVSFLDNLYYLMGRDTVACGVRISDNYLKSLRAIEALLKEVQSKGIWKELPIYVCGLGTGGQLAAVAALSNGEWFEKRRITKKVGKARITKTHRIRHCRINKITAINSAYKWPFSQLSIRGTRRKRKSKIPLLMIYSDAFNGEIPKSSTYTKVKRIKANDMTLGKRWFEVLKDVAEGK